METRIACLERLVLQQSRQLTAVRAELSGFREESEAIWDCLHALDVVPWKAVSSQLSERRRVAAFQSSMKEPGLVLALGHFAGLQAAFNFSTSCRVCRAGFWPVMHMLLESLAPRIVILGGYGGHRVLSAAEAYNPVTGAWTTLSPLPAPRMGCAIAAVGGCLCVVGGSDDRWHTVSTVEKYDPVLQAWGALPGTPTAWGDCAAASMHGCLYIVGGFANGQALNAVECLNPRTNIWSTLPNMTARRMHCAAVPMGDCLYVVGGFDGNNHLDVVEKWDPSAAGGNGEWSVLPPMPTARVGCAAAALRGLLYVVGGWDGQRPLNNVEVYDPEVAAWSSRGPLQMARRGCAAAVVGGRLHVFGGDSGGGGPHAHAEVFDPKTLTWSVTTPMPTARTYCAAAAIRL